MPKTLGDNRHDALVAFLVRMRKQAGFTQVQLAARMKVYQSFIARVESGERRVDVIEFIKLSEVLDFDPSAAVADFAKIDKDASG